MRSLWITAWVVAIPLLGLVAWSSAAQPQGTHCHAVDDRTAMIVEFFQDMLTAPDSIQQTWVDSLGIAGVSPDSVTIVTDDVKCRQAKTKVVKVFDGGRTPFGHQVYVVNIGGVVKAVMDPELVTGEFIPLIVYDNFFNQILWFVF